MVLSLPSEYQPNRREGGEDGEGGFEGVLLDALEDLPAEEDAEEDAGEEDEVRPQGGRGDESGGVAEGQLEEVDEEEEPAEDAEVLALLEAL